MTATVLQQLNLDEAARRRVISERCRAVESALTNLGYYEKLTAWRLAVLLARVAGEDRLVTTNAKLAADPSMGKRHGASSSESSGTARPVRPAL